MIDGVDLVAEPNQTTALVGPSGGGKSTILGLIQRFYALSGGRATIDGQDVAAVDLASLRDKIAFVSQDVFLFRGTIRDNIALGRIGATEAEIVEAARRANAHDFIMSFADGYDANVGEQGTQLSGGQRQRIAIARAMLKNAPILLLDEPTAALDSESEREVQTALDALRVGRTTIVVAHRLQTIIGADRIYVIEKGRAIESGSHEELIARGGAYRAFFAAQFGLGALKSDDLGTRHQNRARPAAEGRVVRYWLRAAAPSAIPPIASSVIQVICAKPSRQEAERQVGGEGRRQIGREPRRGAADRAKAEPHARRGGESAEDAQFVPDLEQRDAGRHRRQQAGVDAAHHRIDAVSGHQPRQVVQHQAGGGGDRRVGRAEAAELGVENQARQRRRQGEQQRRRQAPARPPPGRHRASSARGRRRRRTAPRCRPAAPR